MATIIATAGGSNSNSYATVAEADAYHETHPFPEVWEDAGEDQKIRALITATRMLDTWFDWYGSVTSLGQNLLWPRRGVLRPGASEVSQAGGVNEWREPFGAVLSPSTIPVLIKEATAELARHLLSGDRTADSEIETLGITNLKVGPVDMSFRAVTAKPIPDSVMALVSALGRMRSKTGSGAVHMYRG